MVFKNKLKCLVLIYDKKKIGNQLNVKVVLSLFTKHGCIVYTLIFRLLYRTWKLSLF